MNPKLMAIVSLRSLALLFNLQGRDRTASSLLLVADGLESGVAVDEHMALVAERLKSSDPLDQNAWDDVTSRIQADSARLQAG